MILECVMNVSEGRDVAVIGSVARAAGDWLLDLHSDGDHHRSVLTIAGPAGEVEDAARRAVHEAVRLIDITKHHGVHPRMGAADVVPFVVPPGWSGSLADAVAARDRVAGHVGATEGVPCFFYGPERSLPEVRRGAFTRLAPDTGPPGPHPTAGASAFGARGVLVAYNVWLADDRDHGIGGPDGGVLGTARRIAAEIRGPAVRALGFAVGNGIDDNGIDHNGSGDHNHDDGDNGGGGGPVTRLAQVSCNLVDPLEVRPDRVFDDVAVRAEAAGCRVVRSELVGLAPLSVVEAVSPRRWAELDLDPGRTIEARLESRGVHPDVPGAR